MLLSLISVLVLLVMAFFALWVGVVGRVSSEGPELSIPGRALGFIIAIVAFGVAYAVYQHPVDQSGVVVQTPAVAAMPSAPPESRGQPVVESEDAPSTELLMAPEPDAGEADDGAAMAEPVERSAAEPAQTPQVLSAESDDSLSPSAAALENRVQRSRLSENGDEPRLADVPDVPVTTAASAPAAGTSTEVIGPAKRSRRYPLLLHVQNELGPDQQREQLSLRIEGKTVARIAVDDDSPKASVAIPLPRAGLLHYRLEGFSEASGKTELLGHGCIKVRNGSRYAVRRAADGRRVFLEAARKAG